MAVLVHKKDNKSDPANFHPISLTSLVCKTLEYCVLSQIHRYLQHDFHSGISCETQFIMTVNDWASVFNTYAQVDTIMQDINKVFNKVSHRKVTHKLDYYSIKGKTLLWVAAFLSHQTQFISVDS